VWDDAIGRAEESLSASAARFKAELGAFDARTENCIGTLIPPAQKVARQFMKAAQTFRLTVRIISGTRTYAEQDALYAIGRTTQMNRKPVTKARGGQSNHNFGIAWDVGIFGADGAYFTGKNEAEEDAYRELASKTKAAVQGIEWGGDGKSFPDMPHYQLATGKSVSGIRRLFEAGKSLTA
jgi:peptidoglycan L-alanyl-D-glutamate endopeptidase CwlK